MLLDCRWRRCSATSSISALTTVVGRRSAFTHRVSRLFSISWAITHLGDLDVECCQRSIGFAVPGAHGIDRANGTPFLECGALGQKALGLALICCPCTEASAFVTVGIVSFQIHPVERT